MLKTTLQGLCNLKRSNIQTLFLLKLRLNLPESCLCEKIMDAPNLTLLKIVFWTEYDHPPIIPSDGIKCQARKMLSEEILRITIANSEFPA